MKKHPFLSVELNSTVKLTPSELAKIQKWLSLTSQVVEEMKDELFHKSLIKKMRSLKVSLLICGNSRIRQLNHEFRNKDKVTDVLSFPTYESLRVKKAAQDEENLFLGDLAICHNQTRKQAQEFNISYFDEFIHLFIHGLLHLIGYDHEVSKKEEKIMQDLEDRALLLFSKHRKRGSK